MNTAEKACHQTGPKSIAKKQQPNASISSHKLNHLILHNPSSFEGDDQAQVAEKVKSISERMRNLGENPLEELVMVDTIQRLGIDHLFQEEITAVLHKHYLGCFSQSNGVDCCSNDLHEVSLRFRLLRQEGYHISAHTFNGFLGQDMKFNEELRKDTQGLVSLFEASQMSTQGECILDEANEFSKRILSAFLEELDESPTSLLVQNALKHPLQKTAPRFTAQNLLSTLSTANGWRNELQELAKMDFNKARIIYHNEILHISNWWEKVGLAKELKFARDQPLKWHMWSLAALPDRSLSEQRIEITKPISFIYIIDDIFDVYGTPQDLSLFTEAVNRWELDTLDMLPDYMKLCLKALFDVTNEISYRIWFKYGFNPKDSLQKTWTDLFNAFLAESKWFATGYLPTTTEYLEVATITSGVHVILTHMYFILGGESNTYLYNGRVLNKDNTRIISSMAMILRLWDDLGSCEDEDQDGHDGSYIKCYMNEHEGATNEVARERVVDLISGAWKSLNQELMKSPLHPMSPMKAFTRGCLNLARMVPLMYSYGEDHKLPDLEKFVTSLLHQSY